MIDSTNVSTQWNSFLHSKIVFGEGCLEQLGEICSEYGNSALLVTGRSAVRTGVVDRCKELLRRSHIQFEGFHSVKSDPNVHQINEIAALALERKCEMLIGVGGGSAIDAVKAASVVIVQGGQAEDYLMGAKAAKTAALPVVAVPTIAGSGAELSMGAIVSWPEKKLKGGIRGLVVCPKAAIVDPGLTLTLILNQVKIGGFDIFAHAVETFISRKANPITTMFSCNAIKAVVHYLPKALLDPFDITARTQLSFYSMLMGYNLSYSSTCLPHRLQYPLGAMTHTIHALGVAALYPAWVQASYESSIERFENVALWISEGLGIQQHTRSHSIPLLFQRFMQTIDLSVTLADFGVDETMCSQMVGMVDGNLSNDPWWQKDTDLLKLYISALY